MHPKALPKYGVYRCWICFKQLWYTKKSGWVFATVEDKGKQQHRVHVEACLRIAVEDNDCKQIKENAR